MEAQLVDLRCRTLSSRPQNIIPLCLLPNYTVCTKIWPTCQSSLCNIAVTRDRTVVFAVKSEAVCTCGCLLVMLIAMHVHAGGAHSAMLFYSVCHRCCVVCNKPFDTHCSRMGTAIKHPVSEQVKPSFVIFDIRALWLSPVSVRVPGGRQRDMIDSHSGNC